MDLSKKIPNSLERLADNDVTSSDSDHPPLDPANTFVVELFPLQSKIARLTSQNEKINLRLAGIMLRIDTIQDEIERVKQDWQVS